MRSPILTKTALLAAGLFSAATLSSFSADYVPNYDAEKGLEFARYADHMIVVDTSSGQMTIVGDGQTPEGLPVGSGTLVKTGANSLALDIWQPFYASSPGIVLPNVHTSRNEGVSASSGKAVTPGWTSGELIVDEGRLILRGPVNIWFDCGRAVNSQLGLNPDGSMAGVGTITLNNNGATLAVGDSVLDPTNSSYSHIRGSNNFFVFLNNLRAGSDNTQSGATLDLGFNNRDSGSTISDRYHVDLHVDGSTLADGGSIGIIVGDANVYKTGAGKFTLLGESSGYTGNFYAAGGVLVLDAGASGALSVDSASNALKKYYGVDGVPEFGRTLWAAKSLTLAGTVDSQNESATSSLSEASRNGAQVRSVFDHQTAATDSAGIQTDQWNYYKESYFTDPSAGTLVVNNNQAIRNFQAMFANGVAATDANKSAASAVRNAADVADADAPIIAGTGVGSYLAVAADATLAVYQEAGKGGIYKGTICGVNGTGDAAGVDSRTGALTKGGSIVKYGEGDLALILEGASYEKLAVLEGKNFVVNINAINLDPGSYDCAKEEWICDPSLYIAEGVKFTIVENEAATLKMRLEATDLTFSSYAYIDTVGGQVDVSNNRTPGYVEVASEQRFVDGVVSVENGMTLVLTATDFAGTLADSDNDGSVDGYRYYDKNGWGKFKDETGVLRDVEYDEKDLATGRHKYFYTDANGVKQYLSNDQIADSSKFFYDDSTVGSYTDDSGTYDVGYVLTADGKREYFYLKNDERIALSSESIESARANGKFIDCDAIEFSGGSFGNAAAVVLSGKLDDAATGKSVYSTLAFNGTNQKINNLTGDEYSKVELGTATLTLDISTTALVRGEGETATTTKVSTFDGSISGIGNLVKTGAETLTLGGGASLSYMGSTVIADGFVKATKSRSLWSSSAIILNGATETVVTSDGEGNSVRVTKDLVKTRASFAGAQNLVTLFGAANSEVTLDDGELRLGADVSRRNKVASALKVSGSALGVIVTDDLGNSDESVPIFRASEASSEPLVRAYLKPLLDFAGKGEVLTTSQANALVEYFQGLTGVSAVRDLFGLDAAAMTVTKADVTRLYLKLLRQEGLLADNEATEAMIERLAFDGTVTAKSILKIGDDRATLSGKVEAESFAISAGTLEIDADSLASDDTLSEGVSIVAGATFAINTTGIEESVFEKKVSGDGNFEKLGNGSLVLGENVAYYGTTTVKDGDLTMTLRRTGDGVYAQGNVIVENAASTLTAFQEKDTIWNGTLTNAGNLVKTGAGALEMRGAGSTIAGGVAVKEGSLLFADMKILGVAKERVDLETGEVTLLNAVVADAGTKLTFEENGDAEIDRAFDGRGTLVKAGEGKLTLNTATLAQPDEGERFGLFSGDLRVEAGKLSLATKNIFSENVSVFVGQGAKLYVDSDQTFKVLSGTGDVLISTDSPTTLTLTLANDDKVSYVNDGVYRATVNGKISTDYSEFTKYSGTIDTTSDAAQSSFRIAGAGALVFDGQIVVPESIALSVDDYATLITSSTGIVIRELTATTTVIVSVDEGSVLFGGETSGFNGRTFGKIGSGELVMGSGQNTSWNNANLRVYEGSLALQGANAFSFLSAVVVEGAILSLEYTDTGVAADFSKIEGSGTIRLTSNNSASRTLNISSTSMLGPTPDEDGRYFNGILDAGALKITVSGADVTLCSVQTTGGFATADGSKATFYQAHDTMIKGSFSGNVEITGAGVLTIESAAANGTILVDDGCVCINAAAGGLNNSTAKGLRVKNDATIYFTNTNSQDNSGRLSAVQLRGAVKEDGSFETLGKIELVKTGEATKGLDFSGTSDGGMYQLNVEQNLWNALTGDDRGNASLSVGVSEGVLVVSRLNNLNSKIGLVSHGAGTLEIRAVNTHQILDRSISGDGIVAFSGDKTTTVSVDQAYTGETTVKTGSSVKFDNVVLATSTLKVEEGGLMTGGVRLVGSPVISAETRVASADAAMLVSGGDFVNKGEVTLNVSAGDRIEYAGTFDNRLGTIRLTGASATKRGYEIVLFKSLSGTKMTSEQLTANFGGGRLTNGSSALMLAQTSDGVLSAFSLGTSFARTEGLHDGLSGSFTAVLDELGGLDDVGDYGIVIEDDLLRNVDGSVNVGGVIGSALNRDSADRLADDIANLSPIGFASMIALPRSSFANDVRAISERASHRRFDSTNEIYDNGAEFFARAQSTLRDGSKEADGANFDFNTYGVLVGADVKPDDYSLYGVAVGYDYGSATLHGGGGKIRSDGLRATAFFSSLLGDGTFFADAGAQVGVNRFETDRSTLVGKADGDADGWNVGAFANFGKGIELSKGKRSRLLATPYVGLEYLYSRVGSFDENGVAGLDVDSFDANSLVGRFGVVFDWQFQLGDWEARLSLGAAYAHEFLDDEADVDASFRRVADSKFRATGTIGAADTFSLAPSLTIDLSERNSLQFGYVLEYGTDEQLSHNFNAGFRHTF